MKSKQIKLLLDSVSKDFYGYSYTESLEQNSCVSCGEPAVEFTDELSAKEYKISGLCQVCQDEIWS